MYTKITCPHSYGAELADARIRNSLKQRRSRACPTRIVSRQLVGSDRTTLLMIWHSNKIRPHLSQARPDFLIIEF